ncbi:glycosyltransferase [Fodinibius sediminis]|uniref:Glycosyltransferase involved in cell wall bisynthesis n=1 Tax=Fodinibius sediminis TaxID=1214077 RepID=A0A521D0Z2_9BACT|nr:glycosyltransferase [Fodinibius sediminis]SMO65356.1 Glycosyltransferase involved in cell wall bisynthesis [Fodinibius sediminis]
MKTAIITDFLNQFGGAEIVTNQIASLFPDADIYTMIAEDEIVNKYFANHKVVEHPKLRDSRWRRKHYRKLLPFYPTYIEDFDLRDYDLVISSSYLWAKAVLCRPETLHISYVHTPIRQAWVKYHEYLYNENDIGRFTRPILRYVMNYLRIWDVATANRVDYFIANSTTVKKRIEHIYRRPARVIHPPIKVEAYRDKYTQVENGDYYITVGRLVPYKRVDLLIETFNEFPDRKLLIAGAGNDSERLKALAKSDNISFLGFVDEETKTELVAKAKAFLFAAEEDFGMSPVEAMALGTPVIGFAKGGTRDYIKEGVNGLFFEEQTSDSLRQAITTFEQQAFDREGVIDSVAHFDEKHFRQQFKAFVDEKLNDTGNVNVES